MAAIDLTSQRFGRLTVTALSPRSTSKRSYWLCTCDCGGEINTRTDALRSKGGAGSARSCGCLQKENCVWASYIDQNRNRRNSIYVATEIGAFPLTEYAEMKGMSYYKALRLVNSGAVPSSRPFAESRP